MLTLPLPSLVQAHLPRRNDGTEGLQDVGGSQALLGVKDQQLPDETHCVLRDSPIPRQRGRTLSRMLSSGVGGLRPKTPGPQWCFCWFTESQGAS